MQSLSAERSRSQNETCHSLVDSNLLTLFPVPRPKTGAVVICTGEKRFKLVGNDYGVSLRPFFTKSLLRDNSEGASEPNRCFWIHMGVAVGFHPFALQALFRHRAAMICCDKAESNVTEILSSVQEYGGLVDANSLSFLFPKEFKGIRICFISGISGANTKPTFVCFQMKVRVTVRVKVRGLG
jgi:hypothetical protein